MRSTPGTIVVGVDGSDASKRGLHWAAEQAVAEHRELTLVHVLNATSPAATEAITVAGTAWEVRASGRAVLDAAHDDLDRWAPGVAVSDVLKAGDPRDLLLTMSESADMVVVGSHGRGPVRSLLLGSVGLALVRHAHCPVVVVRPGNPGIVRHGIVVGVDGLPESQAVLEFAYRQASYRRLPLTVVHSTATMLAGTLEAAYAVTLPLTDPESARLAVAEATAGLAEKYPDVRATTRVLEGPAHVSLVRLGERMDLIVVGAHQAGRLHRMISGSVSAAIVEHASCPVAVVPVRT